MMKSRLWLLAPVALLMMASAPAQAADPTVREVYAAARAGQVDKAIDMMNVVLKDHPSSAKAHYVQAELLAKQKRLDEARSQLASAEKLDPALKGIQPQSVAALKQQLNGVVKAQAPVPAPSRGFPWMGAVLVGLAVFALLAFMRRRNRSDAYQPPVGGAGFNAGPNGYGPQGGGYGGYPQQGGMMGGGMGGGLMGSLAAGAAAGVGFAAGEKIIGGMFGGEEHEKRADSSTWSQPDSNADMGGNDFGLSDDSWDSGSDDSGGDW